MMRNCGKAMRILSIVILSVMLVCLLINYSFSVTELDEMQDDLKKSMAEHIANDHDNNYSSYGCSECENNREREEDYERSEISLLLNLTQSLSLYTVFCAILYSLGAILSEKTAAKPQEKPSPFCTNCGKARRPGTRFCAYCGTKYEE